MTAPRRLSLVVVVMLVALAAATPGTIAQPFRPSRATVSETTAEECAGDPQELRAECEVLFERLKREHAEMEARLEEERRKYENVPGGEKVEAHARVVLRASPLSGPAAPARLSLAAGGFRRREAFGLLPPLSEFEFVLSPRIAVDTRGLPVCMPRRLRGLTEQAAKQACAAAQIGTGRASHGLTDSHAEYELGFFENLLLFNGRLDGAPVIVIYGAGTEGSTGGLSHSKLVRSFVTIVRLRRDDQSRVTMSGTLPMTPAPGWKETLGGFRLSLGRGFEAGGARRSYLTASCSGAVPVAGLILGQGVFHFGLEAEAATSKLRGRCEPPSPISPGQPG